MSVKRWLRGPGVSQIGKSALHRAKVKLKGKPYELLSQNASTWMMDDLYRNPGIIQFAGPGADLITTTLAVEDNDYIGKVQELYAYLDKVKDIVKPGCPGEVLKAALCSMASVTEILNVMSAAFLVSSLFLRLLPSIRIWRAFRPNGLVNRRCGVTEAFTQ